MSMRIRVKKKERGHDPEKHSVDKGLCEIAQPLSDISDGIDRMRMTCKCERKDGFVLTNFGRYRSGFQSESMSTNERVCKADAFCGLARGKLPGRAER